MMANQFISMYMKPNRKLPKKTKIKADNNYKNIIIGESSRQNPKSLWKPD